MAIALIGAIALGCGSPAWADPPARVGRIDNMVGSVWLLPYGTQDWMQAVRNQPVSVQDRVATDPGSRAEIDIGSTTVRVGDDSEVWLQQLDDNRVIVDVERGSITSRLRTKQAALSFTAVTNEGKYAPLQPGYYRFDQVPPGSKTTVYEGSVRFDGPDSTLVVPAGQQAEFWRDTPTTEGGAPGPTNYTMTAPERDAFEQWSAMQDQAESRLQQPVYVSPEMPGASDLQQYGQWSDTPEYGAVWTPTAVAADWAPYSDGHWDWVDPWGWTWIDASAWGFAPFHYGRWVRYRERWGWAPGAYVPRPVYAPALVGWVGNAPPPRSVPGRGPGPSVGWFPLSPRDAYVPGFKATPGYIRGVNAGHAQTIVNLSAIAQNPAMAVQNHQYMNRGVPGAMTVVPANVVTERQFVPGFRSRGKERGQGADELARAPVRPVAPVGEPPRSSPRGGAGPRFAQQGQGAGTPVVPGVPAVPNQAGAVPGAPAGFGRPESGRGAPVPAAPAGFGQPTQGAQAAEERRYQQQPVPRAERQGMPPMQGQPVPAAPTGAPRADNGSTRFNHAPEFQSQPQIRAPEAQPPRGDQPRFGATDQAQQVQRAQQQQIEQQQQQQRQQQFQMEQQQRQQRSQVEQQQMQQRQQQAQMEQQQQQQRAQVEQQQQVQRQQQLQMEQQQRQQRSQVEQQQQFQRQQQMQIEQQQRQQRAQVEQQQQVQRQQQMQMEQQQRQQRAQVEQVQRQQQMQQQQQQMQMQQRQQQQQQQAQPPRAGPPGERGRGER